MTAFIAHWKVLVPPDSSGANKYEKSVVIIGAGGFGREILDVIDACNEQGDGFTNRWAS